MTVVPIPYDVLGNVFVYLDRRALVSVCLVNSLFNVAATRHLYGGEIIHNPWVSKWSISPKYASMIRTVIWPDTGYRWSYSSQPNHFIHQSFSNFSGLRAFRWFGTKALNIHVLIELFVELTKIETLQEITLPFEQWNIISNSDKWKESFDCSRVVHLGGLTVNLLNKLSARVLQRLTSIKAPFLDLRKVDAYQRLLLVTHLRDLDCGQTHGLVDGTKLLEPIGRLQNLRTLRLTLFYLGVDIPPFDASLPHLKHFTAIVRRRPRTSTKNVAYIVQTFTADAALEILNLQCDFKGWDTSTIYRAIKRHSKTLQILCAPGWYAHTSMLQALDEFTMLEEVTIGRIVHLEVNVLKGFKRIERVYLYNHQHTPPLATSEVKMLLLQSQSSIHTFAESPYTDKEGRTIDVWRTHWTYDSNLERPRRNVVRCTQMALERTLFQ